MIIDDPETKHDDWLLFVDGDAFPVADVTAYGNEKLAQFPLVAVQRFENNEDRQPHPCFCLTTVAYWRDIKGTWKPGFQWTNPQKQQITDVGGDLLGILQERGDDWYPMLRSNRAKYHPVFFALYDGLAYHHGAGFRKGCSRKAIKDMKEEMEDTFFYRVLGVIHRLMKPGFLKGLQCYFSHEFWAKKLAIHKSQRLGRWMYKRISEDDVFYRDL